MTARDRRKARRRPGPHHDPHGGRIETIVQADTAAAPDPPPRCLDLGNGEALAFGTASDFRAAADYLRERYPDGATGPRLGPVRGPVLNMGYMLRRMIRDGAPQEWTPLMRLIAAEIADDARDPDGTQDGPPWSAIPIEGEIRRGAWRDGLAERTGMSARAISRVLADLAAAGYEMRVPITGRGGRPVRDRRGRLVYAARGHALRFQVPPLAPRPELESSPDLATIEDWPVDNWSPDTSDDGESLPDPATFSGESSPLLARKVAESGDPVSSESPHKNHSPQHVDLAAQPEVEVGQRASGQQPDIDIPGGAGAPLPEPAKPAASDATGNGHRSPRTREETAAEAARQAAALDEWIRQHPEAAATAP
jgi:hypothetical protein